MAVAASRGAVVTPLTSPDSHVWHTPVRHDHLTGTSQASANSSRLTKDGSQATDRLLRPKKIDGPVPGAPAGACGARAGAATMPGVIASSGPNTSVLIRSGAVPRAVSAAARSCMNGAGPHR